MYWFDKIPEFRSQWAYIFTPFMPLLLVCENLTQIFYLTIQEVQRYFTYNFYLTLTKQA